MPGIAPNSYNEIRQHMSDIITSAQNSSLALSNQTSIEKGIRDSRELVIGNAREIGRLVSFNNQSRASDINNFPIPGNPGT